MTETTTGTVLRNAFNGETFIFPAEGDEDGVSRFDVELDRGGSGGGNALVHVHPEAEERFLVRSGRLKVVIRGVEHIVEAGETAIIPKGEPHYFLNDSQGPMRATVEFRPAQSFTQFFENFASAAERRPEWFSKKGDPHLLLIAVTLSAYPDHLYLAGVPIWLQRMIFSLLAPVARWRGYSVLIAPGSRRRSPASASRPHDQAALLVP